MQHSKPPNTSITMETGKPIINQRQAVISAPVNLNPIHNKNTANKTVNNKLIILFTPLPSFCNFPFFKFCVPLGLITVYNERAR